MIWLVILFQVSLVIVLVWKVYRLINVHTAVVSQIKRSRRLGDLLKEASATMAGHDRFVLNQLAYLRSTGAQPKSYHEAELVYEKQRNEIYDMFMEKLVEHYVDSPND